MIEISGLEPAHFAQALDSPGGFAWWYVDAVDNEGNGCVVVWSFGLPFLPGSRNRARARSRPSVHFAAFRNFQPQIYQLTLYDEGEAEVDIASGSGAIGRSSFLVSETADETQVKMELDEPMSGTKERLRVSLSLVGRRVGLEVGSRSSTHQWVPRAVTANVDLTVSGEEWGHGLSGYFDSNAGSVGLHELGIRDWSWGRLRFGKETLIYYELNSEQGDRECHLFLDGPLGLRSVSGSLRPGAHRRGRYGARAARQIDIKTPDFSCQISVAAVIDDGPFYQRFLLRGQSESLGQGSGVGELVIPGKVDLPWQRVFVNMKTMKTSGANSRWLPLFTGDRRTRLARLIGKSRSQTTHD